MAHEMEAPTEERGASMEIDTSARRRRFIRPLSILRRCCASLFHSWRIGASIKALSCIWDIVEFICSSTRHSGDVLVDG